LAKAKGDLITVDDSYASLLILLFLLLSAFFSASETAFFSLSKIKLKKLENSGNKGDKRIVQLLSKPRFLLITILLGNTLVNTAFSSYATSITMHLQDTLHWTISESLLLLLQIIVTTVAVLLFGEITPKLLAYSQPESVARLSAIFLIFLEWILWPLLKLLEVLSQLLSRKNVLDSRFDANLTSEDFKNLISSKTSNHPLEENEKKIIAGIFRFPTMEVREIIVPRVDIVAVEEQASLEELRKMIAQSGYSRIPVYKGQIDAIVGVIYAKDLLLFSEKTTISMLMRPAYFVTENMKVQSLLNQLRSRRLQIAIVVDEYGGTAGLVTLEDILEELVGDIMDEYDDDEPPMLTKIADKEYMINGRMNVADLNNEFDLDIDPEEYDNLADFLLAEFNRLPKRHESVLYNRHYQFIISHIKDQRIHFVRLRIHDAELADEKTS